MPNSKVRNPNTGPYVVSWSLFAGDHDIHQSQECQTWGDACKLARQRLIAGSFNVRVAFV